MVISRRARKGAATQRKCRCEHREKLSDKKFEIHSFKKQINL